MSATPDIAQAVHSNIRAWLREKYESNSNEDNQVCSASDCETSGNVADRVRILYGGSVTGSAQSVDALMRCADIDGVLVGGASLDATSFARIVNFNP